VNNLLFWLANSPLASFAKIFGAGILGWIILNIGELNLHPAVAISLASALPIIINWLNPNDARYGKYEDLEGELD
jgi:hypothetical protein